MKKQKKYYVITSAMPAYPHERFVAGPWARKKGVKRYLRNTTALAGDKEIVKVVEP